MRKKESDLDSAFARKIKESPEFVSWLLSRTKFSQYGSRVRLLDEEQASIRPRKFWWKHWWCTIPELTEQRETDIFVAFEIMDTGERFALHVENKLSNGTFSQGQAEAYGFRARHMMNKVRYLNYTDYQTILISPISFKNKNGTKCDLFNCHITHEDIAKFIPEFGD
jgi:hypothetical protein